MTGARDRPAGVTASPGGSPRGGGAQRIWISSCRDLALPVLAMLALLALVFALNGGAFSYFGINLLLLYAVPLILGATAQMFVMVAGDVDLGIGAFIGLVNTLSVTVLSDASLIGALILLGLVALYALMGALVQIRALPSIIVTLGMSFVWLGAGILVLPRPGGTAPDWLMTLFQTAVPLVPLPVVIALVVAVVGQVLLVGTAYGTVLRGLGANPAAARRAGRSLVAGRMTLYGLAGAFGVLAGLSLTGTLTSGDANIGTSYTLPSVAAVVIGGGEFSGGRVSPVGTVIGAITLNLVGSVLLFLNVSSDWQIGAQGLLLLAVLALRLARRNAALGSLP